MRGYAKALAAAAGAAVVALQPYYGAAHWYIALAAAVGLVAAVYRIPNRPGG